MRMQSRREFAIGYKTKSLIIIETTYYIRLAAFFLLI